MAIDFDFATSFALAAPADLDDVRAGLLRRRADLDVAAAGLERPP